jgi:mono/diheme cytochrome c family protein
MLVHRRRRRLIVAAVVIGALLSALAVVAVVAVRYSLEVPPIQRPTDVAYLQQNWTNDQRSAFYHLPQGSELLPYAWWLAIEQPRPSLTGAPLFRSDAYMSGFGFIPDPASSANPDALPVGFTKDDRFVDPYTGQRIAMLGITCSACHTGELFYGGKAIRIDGGPAMIDLQKLTEALGLAVAWTYFDPLRFKRFANLVLGPNHPGADTTRLREALKYYLDTSFAEAQATKHLSPTAEGYGRIDALGRIGNFVFGTELNNDKNLILCDAPVNFPQVWDASWLDWVQYNGSIQQPMGRNVGEALGVRARINLLGYPGRQYQNTIRVENLHEIELLIAGTAPGTGLSSPAWPEEILGRIDRDKAAKGEVLYAELCVGCHKPPINSPEGKAPQFWTTYTDTNGKQFFKVTMIPIAEIGTDPKQAQNFFNRKADTGPLGLGTMSAVDGLTLLTQAVIQGAYRDLNLSPQQQQEWSGYRPAAMRAPLMYRARPHNGAWATPPYLHNGSVPNLYELLSPVAERSRVFYVGDKQYDPAKLGLNTGVLSGASQFRVDMPGNSNAGHEFKDGPKGSGVIGRALSPEERLLIIEFLKTR